MNKISDVLDSLENLVNYILLDDFRTEEERRAVHESKQSIIDALDLLRRDELVLSWIKEHLNERYTFAFEGGDAFYISLTTDLDYEPSDTARATREQYEAFRAWLEIKEEE